MSQMKIKIVAVELGNATTKTGKPYEFAEVTYKNLTFENKVESKKIMPFGSKEVLDTLKDAKPGDVFTILREKDDAGYWQWIGIAVGDTEIETTSSTVQKTSAKTTTATPTPKSTFETPEERAKKQVYIIRQSSLATAVEFMNHNNKNYKLSDLLDIANQLQAFVFEKETVTIPEVALPATDFDDDIPL